MKIVHIVTRSDNVGGAQVHLRDLSVELIKRGHSIHVLVGGQGPFLEEMRDCGVPVTSLNHLIRPLHPYYDIKAWGEIRQNLRQLKPDLVVAHTSKAGWLGRMAARSLDIPVVFTAHGWSFIQVAPWIIGKFYILAEKMAGLCADKVIAVSEYDRSFCLQHRMLPPHKVITIRNGIPDISYSPADQSPDIPRLIMTARLEAPKNHLFLLKAMAPLKDLPWQLDLVGEGRLRHEIEQEIHQLQLTDRVHLLGARRDVSELLRGAQGFILISDMEGLPISILEAMRAGLPIIASDVGGVAEMVTDGVNGFLIPKGQVEVLTSRLRALFCHRELRQHLGLNSRKKYEEHFHLSDMVDQTLAVYAEIT